MTANLQNPIFTNEDAARAHLEATRWPDGPVCPHCGNSDQERSPGHGEKQCIVRGCSIARNVTGSSP